MARPYSVRWKAVVPALAMLAGCGGQAGSNTEDESEAVEGFSAIPPEPPRPEILPFAEAIGPTGGKVKRLHFGVTGDTRPAFCNRTADYPVEVISEIADSFQREKVQFAVDVGDHMFSCWGSKAPKAQMGAYLRATTRYASAWFMTMGNHECLKGNCLPGSDDPNYLAYLSALKPVSPLPYYSFNVKTSLGAARFIVIADNAWNPTQSAWLEHTLADAEANARYVIPIKHYPTQKKSSEVDGILARHRVTLLITGHEHAYTRVFGNPAPEMIIGIGGAPLDDPPTGFHGYAVIDQLTSGELQVSVYKLGSAQLMYRWTVPG